MRSMPSLFLLLGLATTSLVAISTTNISNATACSPPLIRHVVRAVVPQDGSTTSPATGPIALKWVVEDVFGGELHMQEPLELKVAERGDTQHLPGRTRSRGRQTLVFEPDEPLKPSSVYDVEAVDNAGEVMHRWSFKTAPPGSLPAALMFEGITNLQVRQVAQPIYTDCPQNEVGQCFPDSTHTGWSYPARITLDLQGVKNTSLGPGYYAYKIYQHSSRSALDRVSVVYDTHVLNGQAEAVTIGSNALSNTEFCYSVVATPLDAPATPVLSPQGIVCVPFEQGDFTPRPDPDISDFSCGDTTEPDDPKNPEDPKDPKTPDEESNLPGTPPSADPRDDDALAFCGGCASTPAQGGSTALMWLVGLLGFGVARKRPKRG